MKILILLFFFIGMSGSLVAKMKSTEFVLTESCPPSFELIADGTCALVSMYQMYDSIQNRGVGGLNTSLPNNRQGFTPKQISLGKLLFFDPILSVDGSVSCASCHRPDKGFSDGLKKSVGVKGAVGQRSAPSLWNVAFLDKLFWDARATSLEEQVLGPLFHQDEMANTPENLLASLQSNKVYPALFKQAYPKQSAIDVDNVAHALAAFQSSLISLNSRYDQYAHGFHDALTEKELKGLNIFRSFVARCSECHQPPLFTNNQIAVIGVPEAEGETFDQGAQATFGAKKLRGGFKVPTLRNIASSAPYMHKGNFETLRESVDFYNKGRGHAVPDNEDLQLHWHIWEPNLQEKEIDLIVAFLGALTDEQLTPKVPSKVPSGLPPVDAHYAH